MQEKCKQTGEMGGSLAAHSFTSVLFSMRHLSSTNNIFYGSTNISDTLLLLTVSGIGAGKLVMLNFVGTVVWLCGDRHSSSHSKDI